MGVGDPSERAVFDVENLRRLPVGQQLGVKGQAGGELFHADRPPAFFEFAGTGFEFLVEITQAGYCDGDKHDIGSDFE